MRAYPRNRKDSNHTEMIEAFEALGFVVLDISNLPKCCDLFVTKNNFTAAIELKDGKKVESKRKLTSGEAKFAAKWAVQGRWFKVEKIKDVENINVLAELRKNEVIEYKGVTK